MSEHLNINGVLVRLKKIDNKDYVSLQDIAKGYNPKADRSVISNWMRNYETIEYLGLWESLENDNFNVREFSYIKTEAPKNAFFISPKQWVEQTNAIGIIPAKAGRYSKGTFAQRDIALHFCYWLSPTFQLYLIREFDRLKTEEQKRLGDPFKIKRFLTSGNFSFMVNALTPKIDERALTHPQPYKSRLWYAAEADMLNEIVFGMTAKEWERKNTDKPTNRNMRDYASVLELTILNNLEFYNALLLNYDCDKGERENLLKDAYDLQYAFFSKSVTIKKMQDLAEQQNK